MALCFIFFCIASHRLVSYLILLFHIAWNFIVLCNTVLHCNTLCCNIASYCFTWHKIAFILVYCIILHCNRLHKTLLQCMTRLYRKNDGFTLNLPELIPSRNCFWEPLSKTAINPHFSTYSIPSNHKYWGDYTATHIDTLKFLLWTHTQNYYKAQSGIHTDTTVA